ncbi:hypothetical protein BDV28DRAFT_126607 [Aspergillus coremiiformis]|uniref:Uncharacterized protein n=1 Tax=Aspergillus coremiiformis TaxID=138285 RepID=A0A5N6ZKC6_9EURO|nr:hypothetical protein BDV28DRAFT_126607 [Aspergillus coremiiformis]
MVRDGDPTYLLVNTLLFYLFLIFPFDSFVVGGMVSTRDRSPDNWNSRMDSNLTIGRGSVPFSVVPWISRLNISTD